MHGNIQINIYGQRHEHAFITLLYNKDHPDKVYRYNDNHPSRK